MWAIFKKGQLTVFVILGILIMATIGLIVYFTTQTRTPEDKDTETATQIPVEAQAIRNYVESCIRKEATPLSYEIANRGGTLDPPSGEVKAYYRTFYTYACVYDVYEKQRRCQNKLYSRASMQSELNSYLEKPEALRECISLQQFRDQGYAVPDPQSLEVTTTIGSDSVKVDLNFPLVFTKDDSNIALTDFSTEIAMPLGRLHDLKTKIVNSEILENHFEIDGWYEQYGDDVLIDKHKPYPDIVYSLTKRFNPDDEPLIMNFAIQGYETVDEINVPTTPRTLYNSCFFEGERNCYANTETAQCIDGGGVSLPSPTQCEGVTIFEPGQCEGGICEPCGGNPHGSSWCEYDGPVSPGYDLVGSRHYKRSCVNGKVVYEECRDYREEACVEYGNSAMPKATCVPNRWQQCVKATTAAECAQAGDCYWSDWLLKAKTDETPKKLTANCPPAKADSGDCWDTESSVLFRDDPSRPYETRKCIPRTPPGFKFWDLGGQDVCAMANEMNDCDRESCEQEWVDSTASYCSFMGDCGAYRNIAMNLTEDGFINTDAIGDEPVSGFVYLIGGIQEIFRNRPEVFLIRAQSTPTYDESRLTGNEFTPLRDNHRNLFGRMSAFLQFAANDYTESKFKAHARGDLCYYKCICFPFTGECKFHLHYWTRHLAMCLPWRAPYDDAGRDSIIDMEPREEMQQDCGKCSADEPFKPCTEYRCRSLGESCIYEEGTDGIGRCNIADPNDDIPPEIEFVETTEPELTHSDAPPLPVGTGPDAQRYDGVFICNGQRGEDCNDRNKGIEPYQRMGFTVHANEPVQCKVNSFPILNYRDVSPIFVSMFLMGVPQIENADFGLNLGGEYKQDFTLEFDNIPRDEIRDVFRMNPSFQNFIQLAFPSYLEDQMLRILNAIRELTGNLGGGDAFGWFEDLYRDYQQNRQSILRVFQTAQHSIQTVSMLEATNQSAIFFNCIDRAGNQNPNFVVRFYRAPDHRPPEVRSTEPGRGETIDQNPFTFIMNLNEPAECRYGFTAGSPFAAMTERMQCATSPFEVTEGNYRCEASVQRPGVTGAFDLFVKCLDQPIKERVHRIILEKGTVFNDTDDEYNFVDLTPLNRITFRESFEADVPLIHVNTTNVFMNLTVSTREQCRYTEDPHATFSEIPAAQSLTCDETCTGLLQSPDTIGSRKEYRLVCVNLNLPQRNLLETQFPFFAS